MSLQDLLLRMPPLQDWTEVRAGQGVAHALTAPCRWGPLALALKVRTQPVTPSMFNRQEELPRSTVEEEEEEMDATESDDTDQAKD